MTLPANVIHDNQLDRGTRLRFAPRKGHPLLLQREHAVAAAEPRNRR